MNKQLTIQPSSALAELTATNTRELVRDGKTMFFVLLFPLFFLGLFWFIGYSTDADAATPHVVVAESTIGPEINKSLETQGITTVPRNDPTANILLTADSEHATVTLAANDLPSWNKTVQALRDVGIPRTAIDVVTTDGIAAMDPLRTSMASILMISFLSLAFLGTAVPLVSLRGQGTLRLLGTTPLKRSVFVLSQSPARFGLGLFQMFLVISVTFYLGYLDIAQLPRLLVTALLGLIMLFSLGFLIGSRARNAEATTTVVSLLLPVALMLSGAVIPMQVFPESVVRVLEWLPTTVLANSLSTDLVGSDSGLGIGISWAAMAVVAIIAAVITTKIFRWDSVIKK